MRLWSLHPMYLDSKGLVACWREGLLAQAVLLGKTKGYKNHPQLERFRGVRDGGIGCIGTYLLDLAIEANIGRGYKFDDDLIHETLAINLRVMSVTSGQLAYERDHLASKLKERGSVGRVPLPKSSEVVPHPLFTVVPGGVESWEKEKKE